MDQSIKLPVSQFYYSRALGDLVIGRANNVVSNGVRKQLPMGHLVLNYGRQGDQFYCQVGVSLGSISGQKSDQIWSDWGQSNTVFDVKWISDLINVPSDYFVNQRQSLSNDDVMSIIIYCLVN